MTPAAPRRRARWGVVGGALTLTAGLLVPLALSTGSAQAATPLRTLAAAKNIYLGTSIDPEPLANEAVYRDILAREFNSITTGNVLKWDWVQPNRGQFSWTAADTFVDTARQNNQLVRGHTLVWHNQTPGWVQNLSAAELRTVTQQHIATTVGRYRGRIAHWDVVNEPFEENGTMRNSFWLQKLGPNYIADAFRWARAADPAAKLYLNDYNVEGVNAKSDAMYNLVRTLLTQGVPIDGVGLQAHLIVGQYPSSMEANIRRFAALGVDVAITELDIRMPTPPTAAKLAQQAADYGRVTSACVAVPRCVGITVWSFTDRHSWIPTFFPGEGAALPWDANYQTKPAYDAIAVALGGTAPTGSPSPSRTASPSPSPSRSVPPSPSNSPTPLGGTCRVAYSVSQWNTGFTGNVTVTNGGTTALNGWTLTFGFAAGQRVTQSWNSTVSQPATQVTVTNASWNGAVPAGGSVSFGFNATHTGSNPRPTAFALNGRACTVA